MDLEEVRVALTERIGEQKANHIVTMIMPMVIAAINKMLKAAKPTLPVKEEYHIDDNTSVIEMFGFGCREDETPRVERVCMDRIEIWKNTRPRE